jgi:trimeric autotransporter adhesin
MANSEQVIVKRIQIRRDTLANWNTVDPVLADGEIGYIKDTNNIKIGDGTTAFNSLSYFNGNLASSNLNDLADVTIVSASNGEFLRWNGTAWINGVVNLSTDTVGNYMVNVVAGTGVTVTHTPGEGSSATIAVTSNTFDAFGAASTAAGNAATALSSHVADTTNIHGIADTSILVTTTGTQTLTNKTITTPSGLVKSDVGLASVDNTSDANKPVSTAQQTALDLKANLASPTFTGTVTLPSGTVTSTMIADATIVNADINASAAIVDTKLATISTVGKVSNSATTATDANTASAIVARDGSGNFTAGTITANLTGTASNVTTNANLTGDVTSVGNATSIATGVIVNADVNASAAIVDTKLATIATAGKVSNSATTATNANTASAIVARDASGDFAAGTVTASLTGNASTATTLETARNIAGQSFDGSANISIAPTDLTGVTSTAAQINILDGATLSTTELNYVDGVTSAIQTQIDTKAPLASPTFTGTVTIPTGASITAPTGLVKGDVGLGNVDNTSNATERAATATLTNKTLTSPVINTPTGIVKGDVGLDSVDNTSDASKPVSTAQQTALDGKPDILNSSFTGIQVLTQAEYNALTPVATVIYFIKDV